MTQQRCDSCSAPMILVTNRDGTNTYFCEYCGNTIHIMPTTTSDKVFTFINRAINAVSDHREGNSPAISPSKQAEFDQRLAAINQKRQQAYEKYMEKRIKAYEKYVDKRTKGM